MTIMVKQKKKKGPWDFKTKSGVRDEMGFSYCCSGSGYMWWDEMGEVNTWLEMWGNFEHTAVKSLEDTHTQLHTGFSLHVSRHSTYPQTNKHATTSIQSFLWWFVLPLGPVPSKKDRVYSLLHSRPHQDSTAPASSLRTPSRFSFNLSSSLV